METMIYPAHPGISVGGCIEDAGMTITEVARRIGVTRNNLSRLVHGRIGISPRVADGLEALGWSNAEFWMRRQASYDLALWRWQHGKGGTARGETAGEPHHQAERG